MPLACMRESGRSYLDFPNLRQPCPDITSSQPRNREAFHIIFFIFNIQILRTIVMLLGLNAFDRSTCVTMGVRDYPVK